MSASFRLSAESIVKGWLCQLTQDPKTFSWIITISKLFVKWPVGTLHTRRCSRSCQLSEWGACTCIDSFVHISFLEVDLVSMFLPSLSFLRSRQWLLKITFWRGLVSKLAGGKMGWTRWVFVLLISLQRLSLLWLVFFALVLLSCFQFFKIRNLSFILNFKKLFQISSKNFFRNKRFIKTRTGKNILFGNVFSEKLWPPKVAKFVFRFSIDFCYIAYPPGMQCLLFIQDLSLPSVNLFPRKFSDVLDGKSFFNWWQILKLVRNFEKIFIKNVYLKFVNWRFKI